jgi:hypothetical protein
MPPAYDHRMRVAVGDDVTIVPGHGGLISINDIRNAITALDGMKSAISEQVAKGKTLDELGEMNVLAPWRDLVVGPGRPNYLKSFYDCLTGPPDPKFQL